MMSIFRSYLCGLFVVATLSGNAQDTAVVGKFDLGNLHPIVQVFGTANYDISNDRYAYYFGRAHLGFEYRFNAEWSSTIVIDHGKPTTFGDLIVTDSIGNQLNVDWSYSEGAFYSMYLKFASVRWKVNDKFVIEAGAILQNHYITQERFWGFRYVAQTFQDLYWRIPSTDLGFIAYYNINKHLSVDIALTNGEGPRINQDDPGNIKAAGGIDLVPCDQIKTRIYYHFREDPHGKGSVNEQMLSFFAGIRPFASFRLGGEINYIRNLEAISELDSYGYSLYSAYEIYKRTEIFARFDRLLYDTPEGLITSTMNNGSTLMGGVSYIPVRGISLSLNYRGWISDDRDVDNRQEIALSMEYKF